MQPAGIGVAGQLPQEILIAGSLAAIAILVIESLAGQRDILGVRMQRFAAHLRAQRGDQAAGAQHVGEGVIAGVVEFEADLAGQIEPHGHFFLLPGSGIFLRQAR